MGQQTTIEIFSMNDLLRKMSKIASALAGIIHQYQGMDEQAWDIAGQKIVNEYMEKFRVIVDEWYGSITRTSYDPTMSLHKSYKVEYDPSTHSVTLDWGAHLMPETHRAPSAYIFDLAANKGLHGGAAKGPYHPSPGTYLYHHPRRKGVWLGAAKRSEPFANKFRGIETMFKSQGQKTLTDYYNNISMGYLSDLILRSGILGMF